MNKQFNCTEDFNESLKTEIIAKVDSYNDNLTLCRKNISNGIISCSLILLFNVLGFLIIGWPAFLFMGVFLVLSVLELNKDLRWKKQLSAKKCVKAEYQAEIFRQERRARKEFCLNRLAQKYSNNSSSQPSNV